MSDVVESIDARWIDGNPLSEDLYYSPYGTPVKEMRLTLEGNEDDIREKLSSLLNEYLTCKERGEKVK